MRRRDFAALLVLSTALAHAQTAAHAGPWEMEASGTTAGLRGVHAVGGGVVWASGTDGTVLRTEDSGYMWQSCAMPPGAEKLDFRAIWAWDANTAIVMSSGTGELSRLYKTTDGCSHWTLLSTNPDKDGFWDAMIFTSRTNGLILGDPVGGRLVLLTTTDGGASWKRSASAGLATNGDATGAFAASNSSLVLGMGGMDGTVLFGTTGGFVYRQASAGGASAATGTLGTAPEPTERWSRTRTPLAHGSNAAGVFSLGAHAALDGKPGMTLLAVGGDYEKPREREGTAAVSRDGGANWALSSGPPNGYRSAVAWDAADRLWITVGPNGSDLSRDDGKTWQAIEYAPGDVVKAGEWNALSLPWAVGPSGRIGKLNVEALPRALPPR